MIKSEHLLVYFCLLILLIKIFSIKITNFDLFGDEAQYWIWSKNLDFGYYSKPPLLSWLIALVVKVFGNSFFAIKMISVWTYLLSTFVIYVLSKKILNEKNFAIYVATSFFLMPAVTFSSYIISTDVLLILFWSLSLLQIFKIKNDSCLKNFILLGIFIGLAFLSKYAAVYFFICILFLIGIDSKFRKAFTKSKINIFFFTLTTIIIILPNILWNINNGWLTFQHTLSNAGLNRTNFNFIGGTSFFLSQIFMLGPVIIIFFILRFKKYNVWDSNTKILLAFSSPIFFIVLLEAFLVRANANWAAVSLVSFLIYFIYCFFKKDKKIIFLNNFINLFFGIVFFILISVSSNLEPFKRVSGITTFAKSLVENDLGNISNIVIDDRMLYSNLVYILREQKINIFTIYVPNEKIGHHFQITNALPADFKSNFVFIGEISRIKHLKNKFIIKKTIKKNVGFLNTPLSVHEIVF